MKQVAETPEKMMEASKSKVSLPRQAMSSGDFPCQNGTSVNGEDCSEPWAAELSDDIQYTSIVGRLANQAAQIRSVKLPIGARSGPNLLMELLRFGIFFGEWPRLR